MFYYAIIGFILAILSMGWNILGTKFHRQGALITAIVAVGFCCIVFGWWLRGTFTIDDAMQNYYYGEANGFNRGYDAGFNAGKNTYLDTLNLCTQAYKEATDKLKSYELVEEVSQTKLQQGVKDDK